MSGHDALRRLADAAGLVVGCLAVWRRAPFLVVVVLAAATTAAVRAIS